MTRKLLFAWVTLFLMVAVAHTGAQDTLWTLEKSKDGISVYMRHDPATPIREVRAEVEIDAPLEDLVRALDDIGQHAQWMTGVATARKVGTPVRQTAGTQDSLLYYVIDVPFPFADRDMVLTKTATYRDGGNAYEMSLSGSPGLLPEEQGLVRMPYVKGQWSFMERTHGHTSVMYQFVSDPAGNLPDWMVNAFVVKTAFKTLANLRKRLESKNSANSIRPGKD